MTDTGKGTGGIRSKSAGLVLSLRSMGSHIRASDGRDTPFARAVLTVRNDCGSDVIDLSLHASLGQEGGTVQDVSRVFDGGVASLPAGGALEWDVFDRLLPAHSGTASRLHMFGYRAVLNWTFELSIWADYRIAGAAQPERTSSVRWTLQWSVPDASAGAVVLKIEQKSG